MPTANARQANNQIAPLPDSLAGWLRYLESMHPQGQDGIIPGLQRCQQVAAVLQQSAFCPLISVAGTNGKGSTCAFLESTCRAAGYKTGCYSSPHLSDYNERVRIDGENISNAALGEAFALVEQARRVAGVSLTYFEFGTLAAWQCFRAASVEVMILEVGLGGRLDAVNIYDADVAIVSSIALDHTEWLGDTLEDIAFEKAGIFRAGRPAICAAPNPPDSLLAQASSIGAELWLAERDYGYICRPGERDSWLYWQQWPSGERRQQNFAYPVLRGAQQLSNASAALTALSCLQPRLAISEQARRQGLLQARLAARFQVLPGRPTIVLDVAHNAQATQALACNLDAMGYFSNNIAILGMLGDKDIAATLSCLLTKFDEWLLCELPSARAASAGHLRSVLQELYAGQQLPLPHIQCLPSPTEALQTVRGRAGENDRIVVFGSFYAAADVLPNIGKRC